MSASPSPVLRDPVRLAALRRTALLDSPAEQSFDRLTRLATRLLHAPAALVSLIDEDRQFFKSCVGLPEPWASRRETPLTHSFCQHAVAAAEPLIIDDARTHPLVHDNPAIANLGVAAYAGIPLITASGDALGSFCVIDSHPRKWTDEEIGILRDLALSATTEIELRLQTLEAQETLQARDEILSIISHDLKGPVGVIGTYASLLRHSLPPDSPEDVERLRAGLAQIAASAMGMAAQIAELLDIGQTQAGRAIELQRRPTDLVALTRQVVEAQQHTTRRHDIHLATDLPELMGSFDAPRIERVLTNLLTNAIKYSPSGGDVRVTLAREEDADGPCAVIQVHDSGLGIPAADLPYIFERFRRGGNVAGRIPGSGIGLTSAQLIVHQHGGTIDVVSVQNAGTTFTARLPLLDP